MATKHKQIEIPLSISAQVLSLTEMPINDLRDLWRATFKSRAPTDKRRYLERRLSHQLQEDYYRTQCPEQIELNQKRIKELIAKVEHQSGERRAPSIKLEPGTTFIREYKEQQHIVQVMLDGDFEYNGCRYNSLSQIASLITGAHCSGPAFFGVKTAKSKTKRRTTTRRRRTR